MYAGKNTFKINRAITNPLLGLIKHSVGSKEEEVKGEAKFISHFVDRRKLWNNNICSSLLFVANNTNRSGEKNHPHSEFVLFCGRCICGYNLGLYNPFKINIKMHFIY